MSKIDIVAKTINDIRLMIIGKNSLSCEEIKTIDKALAVILEYLHCEELLGGEK